MSSLKSTSFRTDPYAALTLLSKGYTSCTLQFSNTASTSANFRVFNLTRGDQSPPVLSVAPGATKQWTDTSLAPGSTYSYYLQRYESGTWVNQIADISTASQLTSVTLHTCELQVSVATVSAVVSFKTPSNVVPTVDLTLLLLTQADYDAKNYANMVSRPTHAVGAGTWSVALTELVPASQYVCVLAITPPAAGGALIPISSTSFTTAVRGTLTVNNVTSTSAEVAWTGDDDDVFKVLDQNGGVVITAKQGPASMLVSNLVPGVHYSFTLQMMEDGVYADQATVSVTTPTPAVTNAAADSTTTTNSSSTNSDTDTNTNTTNSSDTTDNKGSTSNSSSSSSSTSTTTADSTLHPGSIAFVVAATIVLAMVMVARN